ncbi:DUF7619 domain-containing protein [Cesiribacter andamanensis]|uniref:Uncharacterized protein n=1 Tax=Cesiribacter andamanensis AMV16 TaxID=1279009 RepID=M7N620_9BACT|nr:T9SS type A sorting domain-containing protein [Cesiribacter andamanensis]EMR02722.1 hypothetical protein ADICEAN_02139 [Cesiribacter andamanensis AMV16]
MIRFFTLLLLAGFFVGAQAQTPSLLKDVVPGNRGLGYRLYHSEAETSQFLITGNAFYFYSIDPLGKIGFWRSTGTSAGTYPLLEAAYSRELATAIADYQMSIPAVALGDGVYFVWQDAEQRPGIWKATESSVEQAPMPEEAVGKLPRNLTAFQGGFLFSTNSQLWKSDGTAAGTQLIKEFSDPYQPLEHLTPQGNAVYFLAYDEAGRGIWKTDGSTQGTTFLHDLSYTWLTPYEGNLYFPTPEGSMSQALWKLETSTDRIGKLGTFDSGVGTSYPHQFTRAAGKLFFLAHSPTDTIALHVTDGTPEGTYSLVERNVNSLMGFKDKLFLASQSGTTLKSSQGMPGDVRVEVELEGLHPSFIHATEDILYFSAVQSAYGRELWRTDGTQEGTYRISDIREGALHTSFGASFIFKEGLYFLADDGVHGLELWKLAQPGSQLSGRAFLDSNKNGMADAGETGLMHQQILVEPGNTLLYTNNAGLFSLAAEPGTYQVTLLPADDWAISSAQTTFTLTVPGSEQALFGVYLANERRELDVRLTPASSSRCSVQVPYWLQLQNKGNVDASGQLQLRLDPQAELMAVSPAPSSSEDGVLLWNFENLPPTQQRNILLYIKMPDFRSMGDTLRFYSQASFSGTEIMVKDTLEQILLCSYDPNDKLVKPAGINPEHFTLKNSWLDYTIRFQNTGNAEALTVVLRDTLDQHLDLSSFELLGSSHPMQLSRKDRALTFQFDDINLPDSTSNEPESHGFVRYRIRAKAGVAENTVVENTAHIFFDFNPAIVTNTTFNTLVSKLPERVVNGLPKGDAPGLHLYPNPTSGELRIESATSFRTLSIRNTMGQVVHTELLPGGSTSHSLSIATLPAGLYLIEIGDGRENLRKRLIKK